MNAELVSSTPIDEMCDTMLNPASFIAFQRYLGKECGCTCIALDDKSIIIHFPEGTMEEEYTGRSTMLKRETTIRLPNDVKLIKRVHLPMMEGQKELVALLLPKNVFSINKEVRGFNNVAL
jgi:hypothetical protein